MPEEIEQLSLLEKSKQAIFLQKQQFSSQLLEIENALREMENAKEVYKQVGTIIVLSDKAALQNEMKSKKETAELRIKSLDKQEAQILEKMKKLQETIMSSMKGDEHEESKRM